uniref:PID domain-containing protein n=1 Tax=Macrostomum lignano TaxID=282301 RepID=A0A1I8FA25_9PLAT
CALLGSGGGTADGRGGGGGGRDGTGSAVVLGLAGQGFGLRVRVHIVVLSGGASPGRARRAVGRRGIADIVVSELLGIQRILLEVGEAGQAVCFQTVEFCGRRADDAVDGGTAAARCRKPRLQSSRQRYPAFLKQQPSSNGICASRAALDHVTALQRGETLVRAAAYIGSFAVEGADPRHRSEFAHRELDRMRNYNRSKPVQLWLALSGIKVCDEFGRTVYMAHALRRISYASCNPDHCQFAFMAREPKAQSVVSPPVGCVPTPDGFNRSSGQLGAPDITNRSSPASASSTSAQSSQPPPLSAEDSEEAGAEESPVNADWYQADMPRDTALGLLSREEEEDNPVYTDDRALGGATTASDEQDGVGCPYGLGLPPDEDYQRLSDFSSIMAELRM